MFLSQTVEYSFRAMAVLALLEPGQVLRVVDLAERTGIPGQYLAKIMRRLVVGKLVTSRRGHGGGFALARRPEEIRLLDILTATDYELEPDRCAFGIGACNPRNPCSLHTIWSRLHDCVASWATGLTLADLDGAPRSGRTGRSRGRS